MRKPIEPVENSTTGHLRQMLFQKGDIAGVLEHYQESGVPDGARDPEAAMVYAHALRLQGNYQMAEQLYIGLAQNCPGPAERLWGLAEVQFQQGHIAEAEKNLKKTLELLGRRSEPGWLIPYVYKSLADLYRYQNKLSKSQRAIDQGKTAAIRQGQHLLIDLLDLTQGTLEIYRQNIVSAVSLIERAYSNVLAQGHTLYAAYALTNLAYLYIFLAEYDVADRLLARSERLCLKAGCLDRLIYVKHNQATVAFHRNNLELAQRIIRQAMDMLRFAPNPFYQTLLHVLQADVHFSRRNIVPALDEIKQAEDLIQGRGIYNILNHFLIIKASYLVKLHRSSEGLPLLHQLLSRFRRAKQWVNYCQTALYVSLGCFLENNKRDGRAWFDHFLKTAQAHSVSPAVFDDRDALVEVLMRYGDSLPVGEYVCSLIIRLQHPGLLKRMLKKSPEAKMAFIRSVQPHECLYYRQQLSRLQHDPSAQVRRTVRFMVSGWQNQANYQAHLLGGFRLSLDNVLLPERTWDRPLVKKLLLYLLARPGEWIAFDELMTALWPATDEQSVRPMLISLFSRLRNSLEPWCYSGQDYAFLQSRRGAYGFFPGERFVVDWMSFSQHLKQAEQSQLARSFKEARTHFRAALDLYDGDLLEEYQYEEWLTQRRIQLRETYFRAVAQYAKLECDSGNLPEARRVLENVLFRDLSRSACLQLLVEVLQRMRLFQEARDWGQRHTAYLKRELHIKPDPALQEALQRIQ